MVHRNLTKYIKLYRKRNCPEQVHIPINDLMAWAMYPQYREAYDRMKLAAYQGLIYGMMPIKPKDDHFPIVVKPIINLYGMGHQSYRVRNSKAFNRLYLNTGFWMEYLEGVHHSFDLIVVKGKIVWKTSWIGHYLNRVNKHGVFDYWEPSHNDPIPEIINKYLQEKMPDYTGCLNVECIGDKIIEMHLRMGDLDQLLEPEVLDGVINLYIHGTWPDSLTNLTPKPVYLFPIWGIMNIRESDHRGAINDICRRYKLYAYNLTRGELPAPPGKLVRVGVLVSKDFFAGNLAQYEVNSYLKKWGYKEY